MGQQVDGPGVAEGHRGLDTALQQLRGDEGLASQTGQLTIRAHLLGTSQRLPHTTWTPSADCRASSTITGPYPYRSDRVGARTAQLVQVQGKRCDSDNELVPPTEFESVPPA